MQIFIHFLRAVCLLALFLGSPVIQAQSQIYPPHWFQNTKNDTLELLIFEPEGFKSEPELRGAAPRLISSTLANNVQYAYVLLSLEGFAGDSFTLHWNGKERQYALKAPSAYKPKPLSPADALYLITPDRFANGVEANDYAPEMNDTNYGRDSPFGRHGGDIAGINQKLDYIQETGFNALWISPLLENDEYYESYHGYAITDHYNIDKRFGSNEAYGKLLENMHNRGMKMVMDVVYNHFGDQHPLFVNPPDSSFFHFHPEYLRTSYRAVTLLDPHVSKADKKVFTDGWFDRHMPDVNQGNAHMARFLIQNSIWWILEYGVDAFRIDTYAYPDQQFMSHLARRIQQEVPGFFLFGEVWVHQPEVQSYFAANNKHNPINTHLSSVTDFQFNYAVKEALHNTQGWNSGVTKLYYRLAADYLYERPDLLVTFIDNHDKARVFGELGKDTAKLKVALGLLYTVRGIPCTYYGTEILMEQTENHGVIRQDFPGGWPNDSINKFTAAGRTESENNIYNYLQRLLKWRVTSAAITHGNFTHFVPENDVYVYFRESENDKVMVLVNTHPHDERQVDLSRFSELWPAGTEGENIITGKRLERSSLLLKPMSISVIQKR